MVDLIVWKHVIAMVDDTNRFKWCPECCQLSEHFKVLSEKGIFVHVMHYQFSSMDHLICITKWPPWNFAVNCIPTSNQLIRLADHNHALLVGGLNYDLWIGNIADTLIQVAWSRYSVHSKYMTKWFMKYWTLLTFKRTHRFAWSEYRSDMITPSEDAKN